MTSIRFNKSLTRITAKQECAKTGDNLHLQLNNLLKIESTFNLYKYNVNAKDKLQKRLKQDLNEEKYISRTHG